MKHDERLEAELDTSENWVGAACIALFLLASAVNCAPLCRFLMALGLIGACTGCMAIVGAEEVDAWGLKLKANSGVEFNAGMKQYDYLNERKGSNIPQKKEDK